MAPAEKRLKSAEVAALNIRHRQEELKNQLAAIDRGGTNVARTTPWGNSERHSDRDVSMTDVGVDTETGVVKKDGGSSSSSSSSSESSDSDSDSDSESDSDDGGAPLQRVGL